MFGSKSSIGAKKGHPQSTNLDRAETGHPISNNLDSFHFDWISYGIQ